MRLQWKSIVQNTALEYMFKYTVQQEKPDLNDVFKNMWKRDVNPPRTVSPLLNWQLYTFVSALLKTYLFNKIFWIVVIVYHRCCRQIWMF